MGLPILSCCFVFAIHVPLEGSSPWSHVTSVCLSVQDRHQGEGGPGCALYGFFSRDSDPVHCLLGKGSTLQLPKASVSLASSSPSPPLPIPSLPLIVPLTTQITSFSRSLLNKLSTNFCKVSSWQQQLADSLF